MLSFIRTRRIVRIGPAYGGGLLPSLVLSEAVGPSPGGYLMVYGYVVWTLRGPSRRWIR